MHATNLGSVPQADEVTLFDPVPQRAAEVAGELNEPVRYVDTVERLLAECDGIVIATPTGTHAELIRDAVDARVPVLCEKPLAGDQETMRDLIGAIDAAGVEVVVGFQRRFDPATVELHRRLRAGEAGDVYLVRAVCNDFRPPAKEFVAASGGLFTDCLIHDLDAVPWLVGEPVVEVYASGSVLVDEAFAEVGDVDNAVAMLRFAGGAHALLSTARRNAHGYDCRLEVFGSEDSLAVGLDPRTPVSSLEVDGPKVAAEPYAGFPDRYLHAYVNELAVFCDVVQGQARNPSPARESLASLELARACEQSHRSGAPIRLDAAASRVA